MTDIENLILRREALTRAIEAAQAEDWLLKYGHQGIECSGEGVIGYRHRMTVQLSMGSLCEGSNAALRYLNAAASFWLPKIIDHAIREAQANLKAVEEL